MKKTLIVFASIAVLLIPATAALADTDTGSTIVDGTIATIIAHILLSLFGL